MRQTLYFIYDETGLFPKRVMLREPADDELLPMDRVCVFFVDMCPEKPTDIKFDADKEWFPKNSLFCVYELFSNGEQKLLGSDQGYSHKHARSLIKNLNIAYPNNTYIMERVQPGSASDNKTTTVQNTESLWSAGLIPNKINIILDKHKSGKSSRALDILTYITPEYSVVYYNTEDTTDSMLQKMQKLPAFYSLKSADNIQFVSTIMSVDTMLNLAKTDFKNSVFIVDDVTMSHAIYRATKSGHFDFNDTGCTFVLTLQVGVTETVEEVAQRIRFLNYHIVESI